MRTILPALALLSLPLGMQATEQPTETPAPEAAPASISNSREVTTHELISMSADARVDYQYETIDEKVVNKNSGFEGKYFMFRVDGEIVPGLTYSWRQRLNKAHKDASFFDATDWVYVDWTTGRWGLSAGKEIVAIGGWEYDRNPIHLYSTSVFWQNIPCYQLGASVKYAVTSRDKLTAQVVQSPFHTADNRNLYGYNLMWAGTHGIYSALWSVNMMEYAKGEYVNYIALGNQFNIGNVTLEVDVMNRAASTKSFLGKDMSVMAEAAWCPSPRWRIHGKYTYDKNHSDSDADLTVLRGTELSMAGGGVEFYPLLKKKTSLRIHANAYYSWGKNKNADDVMQNKTLMCSAGITWHMDFFSYKR